MAAKKNPPYTWHRRKDGSYFSSIGHAELVRRPGPKGGRGSWYLVHAGREYLLGPRATFDAAEKIIARPSGGTKAPVSRDAPAGFPMRGRGGSEAERVAARATAKKNPIEVLRANRRQLVEAATQIDPRRLKQILAKAQTEMNARLRQAEGLRGPGDESFTAAQLRASLAQIELVLRDLEKGIKTVALDVSVDQVDPAVKGVVDYLVAAEARFNGIAERLPIKDAVLFERARSGARSSSLHRLEGDPKRGPGILDRYGDAVVESFERRMQQRLIAKTPWEDVRNGLIADSPFLQEAPAHWAERIVRTEAMNGSNRAIWEANKEAEKQLGDVVKFLSATFDDRTAADSYAVHGQCRRPNEAFDTWQGAVQHPPARPNDREIVVTYRTSWPIPSELRQRSAAEVSARWLKEGRKGAHPPIPRITTVPFSSFAKA